MGSRSWHLILEVAGIDLDDDQVVNAFGPRAGFAVDLRSVGAVTTVEVTVRADSVDLALRRVLDIVARAAPGSKPFRLVDPLVAISDIADLTGVTRQGVRNWALGQRHSGFPREVGIVGDGIRVWRLAEVDAWLSEAMTLGSGRGYPSALFIAQFNSGLWNPPDSATAGPTGDAPMKAERRLVSAQSKTVETVEVEEPEQRRPSRAPVEVRSRR